MNNRPLMRLVLVVLLAACVFAQATERIFKTYPLQTADTKPVIEAARMLLGEDGNVIYYGANNQLMVSATPEGHTRIRGLLGDVNRPVPNVRIVIDRIETDQASHSGGSIHPSGKVLINGKQVRVSGQANAELYARSTTEDKRAVQTLMVRSGTEGAFFVGQEVPFIHDLTRIGLRHGQLIGWGPVVDVPEVEWRSVGASLRLKATVVGEGPMINIEVTPELSGLVDDPDSKRRLGSMRRIRFSTLTTQVSVRDGQTISLGGLVKDRSFYDKFLIGVDRAGNRSSLNIKLTPQIVK